MKIIGKGAPKAFQLMPEGEQTLMVVNVDGAPRTNVSVVTVEFVNKDGIRFTNRYDLTNAGGYAAFYFLLRNGLGIDLEEGAEFDLDAIVGKYVKVLIVHKQGSQVRDDGTYPTFVNIKQTLGPGEPFDYAEPSVADWD